MVKGMDKFREYFAEYADQYILIGGAACDISFNESNMDFRATKDLDMVLIVEAQTKEFAQRFWELSNRENTGTGQEETEEHNFIVLINRRKMDFLS